jgi:cellobiose phosphorylase
MQYGYFDDKNKEYVITKPDTPKSWSNYLGSKEFGAIITNNAGGYTFYKSGGMGRFIRMRFNSIPMDQPGRYIYFHDHDSGDYWSASWQPVGKPLDQYKSQCCHGTAYTRITSEYKGITSEVTYFVPLNCLYELWKVRITNNSSRKRNLSGFTYQEYAATWNALDDLLNLQYVQYTAQMKVIDGIIDHGTNVNIPPMPDNFEEKDQGRHTFQAVVGARIIGYDTNREVFIGPYRSYSNPIAVEKGKCNNSLAYGDNPCGSFQFEIILEPNQSLDFLVIIGIGKADEEGKRIAAEYKNLSKADDELARLKEYWHTRIKGLTAETPDPLMNSMINMWSIYNCMVTFAWSRAASLIYTSSERDGLGYRDTVQDFLGPMHAITDEVRERLELMITGQVSTGGAMPVVRPLSHKPGHEKAPDEEEYRSDDCLWLFNAIPAYVKETGDISFYDKVLPYADKGEDTVMGHLKRAIQFNLQRSGAHGLPCGLRADWNDCLRFGHNGESIFVAMQLRLALKEYIDISKLLNRKAEEEWAQLLLNDFDQKIQQYAWDGGWFMRGYRFDGMKFGSKENHEGQIYLNPQVWSIISGAATGEQAETAMKNVKERLATEYGISLCDPPYTSSDYTIVRAQLMNPGTKENGSIFMHTQGWAVIAEAMLGHGNQAYTYLKSYLPSSYNDKAEIREIEPYVVCQTTHSKYSPGFGKSRIPWLSGSATWTYYAISQYMLGIRPEYFGITIDPCIPSEWSGFKAVRKFRNKILHIEVRNEKNVEKGVEQIIINEEIINGNYIPVEKLKQENNIIVKMGK